MKKSLAILLALVMLLILVPTAVFATTPTVHTYYVGGTGATDTRTTGDPPVPVAESTPFATVFGAVNYIIGIAKTTNADNPFESGDTVEIIVTGEVYAQSNAYSGLLNSSGNGSDTAHALYRPLDKGGNLIPVVVKGSTANAADTVLVFKSRVYDTGNAESDAENQGIDSSVRKFNTMDLTFQNVTFKAEIAEYFLFSAHAGSMTFDNVVFDDAGFAPVSHPTATNSFGGKSGWIIDCGNNNNQNTRRYFLQNGYTSSNPAQLTSTATFKNGNYENVEVVGCDFAGNGGQTALNPVAVYHAVLNIGVNAVMGDIIGCVNNSAYKDVTINIDPTATVRSVKAFGEGRTDAEVIPDIYIVTSEGTSINGYPIGVTPPKAPALVLYVSSTGSDSAAGSKDAPLLTVKAAVDKFVNTIFDPGDTVEIIVTGTVKDKSTTGGSGVLTNSANGAAASGDNPIQAREYFPKDSEGNKIPVIVKGSTENAADTTIVMATSGPNNSSVRKFNTMNLTFQNLTLKTETAEYLAICGHTGSLTLDNVILSDAGFPAKNAITNTDNRWGWIFDCGNNNNSVSRYYYEAAGYTSSNKAVVTASITLKNGNYTNARIVGLGYGGSIDRLVAICEYHAVLNIGENAVVGDIVGSNGANKSYTSLKINIDPTATVASVAPFGAGLTDEGVTPDVTIDNKGVVTVNGVKVNTQTADSTSYVLFGALAIASLVGVVVLKKKGSRA